MSQFEGFFGQLAFQTSNFLGRGESATFSVLAGRRARNYQVAFTEPFLFDRPITAGIDLFNRELIYLYAYTQASAGGNVVVGFPVADFSRMFMSYSLQQVRVKDVNPLYLQPEVISRNPFLQDALLVGEGGRRTISQFTPSFVHNTIDNPIFPTTGRRYTASIDVAGLGGNVNFLKPRLEGVWIFQHTRRTSLGFRGPGRVHRAVGKHEGCCRYSRSCSSAASTASAATTSGRLVPAIRSPASSSAATRACCSTPSTSSRLRARCGWCCSMTPGQVPNEGASYAWDEFKTSTGAEIRFFMPVLNVPFRLIFAHNPQREGVLDNNLVAGQEIRVQVCRGVHLLTCGSGGPKPSEVPPLFAKARAAGSRAYGRRRRGGRGAIVETSHGVRHMDMEASLWLS